MNLLVTRCLLLMHAVGAGVLVGSSTHLAVHLVRNQSPHRARIKLYSTVALVAWLLVVLAGACAYPAYRVHVRAAVLDASAPWTAAAFDFKEALAIFVGPLLWSTRRLSWPESDAFSTRWALRCACVAASLVWFNALVGLWTTLVKAP